MYFIFWRAVRLSRKDGAGWGRGRVSCGGWCIPIIKPAYLVGGSDYQACLH